MNQSKEHLEYQEPRPKGFVSCCSEAWSLAHRSRPLRTPLEFLWALATVSCNDAEAGNGEELPRESLQTMKIGWNDARNGWDVYIIL